MKRLFITMLVAVLFGVAAQAEDTLTTKECIRKLDARVVQLESLTEHLQAQVKELQARLDSMVVVPKDAKEPQTTGKENAKENQCKAVTQKGTRCTRIATDGGYCWQHKR